MANIASCAFAVAKDDIEKLGGAIRRATESDKEGNITVYTHTYTKDDGAETYLLTVEEGYVQYKWMLTKDGKEVAKGMGFAEQAEKTKELGLVRDDTKYECLKDLTVDNGWVVNWEALDSYSYDVPPSVADYEDHITVYFGGRWDFPQKLEDKLNSMGVRWQGAGVEDGMGWQNDEMGNEDFGLRITQDREEDGDGEYYTWSYVEDITK